MSGIRLTVVAFGGAEHIDDNGGVMKTVAYLDRLKEIYD